MKKRLSAMLGVALLGIALAAGCSQAEPEGAMEEAGAAVDNAVEQVEDAAQEAGQAMEEGAEAVGDAVQDAGQAVENAAETN